MLSGMASAMPIGHGVGDADRFVPLKYSPVMAALKSLAKVPRSIGRYMCGIAAWFAAACEHTIHKCWTRRKVDYKTYKTYKTYGHKTCYLRPNTELSGGA